MRNIRSFSPSVSPSTSVSGVCCPEALYTWAGTQWVEVREWKMDTHESSWREEDLVPPITAHGYKLPKKKRESLGANSSGPK